MNDLMVCSDLELLVRVYFERYRKAGCIFPKSWESSSRKWFFSFIFRSENLTT